MSSKSKSISKSLSKSSSRSPEEISQITEDVISIVNDKLHIVKDIEDVKKESSKLKLKIFNENIPDGKKGKHIQLFKGSKLVADKVIPKSEWKKVNSELKKKIKKQVQEIKENPEKVDELLDNIEDIRKNNIPLTTIEMEDYMDYKLYQEYIKKQENKSLLEKLGLDSPLGILGMELVVAGATLMMSTAIESFAELDLKLNTDVQDEIQMDKEVRDIAIGFQQIALYLVEFSWIAPLMSLGYNTFFTSKTKSVQKTGGRRKTRKSRL